MSQETLTALTERPDGVPGELQHFIAGQHRPAADGGTFATIDPTNNRPYATVAAGTTADIDAAVSAATTAYTEGPWPRMTARQRATILQKVADLVEARDQRLATLESFDTGLPITQALGQARRAAENFRFFADLIVGMSEQAYGVPGVQLNYVHRKPVGVAGLITPWNTPFMLESWKLAPAIASGCTVVLKPAEWSPLSASLWPEIFAEAGLPDGVFNMVHGIGEQAGAALVDDERVKLISFTGETTTGSTIFAASAPYLRGLSMELGGKSPVLVFADADLDAAIDSALFGVYSLNGERCTAGSRILVHRDVYDEFAARFAERARRIKVGDPRDPATEVGALIHPEHHARVMDLVESGRQQATLLAGGTRPPGLEEGNFLLPTVFGDVDPSARIFQEEIFGPVVALTPFDDDADAIRLANGVRYGLAAYIWTKDLARGHNVAHAIEAGMVWLNSHNVRDLRTPFGGVKASGLGHEGGYRSLDFYTEEQAVHVSLGSVHTPKFGK